MNDEDNSDLMEEEKYTRWQRTKLHFYSRISVWVDGKIEKILKGE